MSIIHETKLITLLLTMTLLSGMALTSMKVSADTDSTDTVSLTVPIACTMTGEGTSHTATLDPGTYSGATGGEYENGIGKTTLTAICNDDNGFSIYAIGYTGNQYEGENHTKLIGQSTNSTIATKAYASGDTTSNWSMKLTKVTDSTVSYNPQNLTISSDTEGTFDTWHSVPDTYTKVAQYHANTGSSTTDTTLGVKLGTTYAAYISSSQPADTYVGQVKYTLVHPYDHAEPDEFTSETLQSVADWGSKVALGQTVTVTDARDGQEYTVARLADGKLWMTKNLRLDIGRANITAENTNNPTQAFLTAASNASSSNEWCTDNNSTCTDQIKYNTSNINNPTTDSEGHKYDEYGVYYNWYTATAGNGTYDMASNTNVSGDICPSGWHLPTGTNTSVGAPNIWTGDYWRLAAAQDGGIASDNSNHNTIVGATGSERLRSSPNNFLYSGYFNGNTNYYQGESGYYWTATKSPYSNYIYTTYLNSTSISPGYSDHPTFFGIPVRCETELGPYGFNAALANAGKTKHNDYYKIQDADLSICSGVTEGQEIDLIDERDDEVYKVAKLADGNCWMLDNLALDPTDSTVAANMNEANTNAPAAAITNYLNGGNAGNNTNWSSSPVEHVSTFENNDASSYDGVKTPRVNSSGYNSAGQPYTKDTYIATIGGGTGRVGVYYNFCAASIGTVCSYPSVVSMNYDVCPINWHIPTILEFTTVYSSYGAANPKDGRSLSERLKIPLTSYYWDEYRPDQASSNWALLWSSTAATDVDAFYPGFTSTDLETRTWYKRTGMPIRCMLR